MRAFDGLVHIGVGKYDVRALAAQFQGHALEIAILAAASMIRCPTSVEPVNATLSTSMWLAMAAPAVGRSRAAC